MFNKLKGYIRGCLRNSEDISQVTEVAREIHQLRDLGSNVGGSRGKGGLDEAVLVRRALLVVEDDEAAFALGVLLSVLEFVVNLKLAADVALLGAEVRVVEPVLLHEECDFFAVLRLVLRDEEIVLGGARGPALRPVDWDANFVLLAGRGDDENVSGVDGHGVDNRDSVRSQQA